MSTPRVRGGPEGLPSEPGPPAAVGSGAHPDSRLEVLGGTALNLIRIFPPSEIRQNNKGNRPIINKLHFHQSRKEKHANSRSLSKFCPVRGWAGACGTSETRLGTQPPPGGLLGCVSSGDRRADLISPSCRGTWEPGPGGPFKPAPLGARGGRGQGRGPGAPQSPRSASRAAQLGQTGRPPRARLCSQPWTVSGL